MRIYHFIDSNGCYGAETLILALISEQINQGLSPKLISLCRHNNQDKAIDKKALQLGIEVLKLKLPGGLNPLSLFPFYKFIKSHQIDIVHSHGYRSNVIYSIIRIIRKDDTPCIATVHGYTSIGRYTKNFIYECLDRKLMNFFDAVAIVDLSMRQRYFSNWSNSNKIHFVPNGISPSLQTDNFSQECDPQIVEFCNSGFTIGSVGRLSKEKNHSSLIRAFEKFSESVEDARLILIGDGPLEDTIKKQIDESRFRSKILLTGYLNNAANYISLFKVFALCSITEGLPIVILEAMKAKTPILSTRVGSIPYVLKDTQSVQYVSGTNEESIFYGIISIYNNYNQYYSNTIKTYNKLVNSFTIQSTAEKYLSIYKLLM